MIPDQIGSKLGPKLGNILIQVLNAHKEASLASDANARQLSTWNTVVRFGDESRIINQVLYGSILKSGVPIDPDLHSFLSAAVSGSHQVVATVAGIVGGTAAGGLGAIVSDAMAPIVQDYLSHAPLLLPDSATAAALATRGWITEDRARDVILKQGLSDEWGNALLGANRTWPPLEILFALQNRGQLPAEALQGYIQALGYPSSLFDALSSLQRALLSPADAALAELRGALTHEQAVAVASSNGLREDDYNVLLANTGEPPPLDQMLSLWRRKLVTDDELDRAIRQSRYRDEWIPTIHKFGIIPPSPLDMLEALLEGQLDHDQALAFYEKLGGDPDYFQILFDTRGQAPTPLEAANMAFRGVIPWSGHGPDVVSFEQAFLEGPWRNKWLDPYKTVAQYLPPPRTITAMLREGSLDDTEGLKLLQAQGLSADLAAAYVTSAHHTKTQAQRDLAVSEIQTLYEDQAISREAAGGMLVGLRFSQDDADFILTISDFRRVRKFLETAISKIHSLYVAHRIDFNNASSQLDNLGVASDQRDQLLNLWDIERTSNVTLLTAAQVKSAYKKQIEGTSKEWAIDRLVNQHGYSTDDANIFLQI